MALRSQLTREQRLQLREALNIAFPDVAGLSKIAFRLGGSTLDKFVAPQSDLDGYILKFIVWAESHSQVDALVHSAIQENSTNTELRECALALGLLSFPSLKPNIGPQYDTWNAFPPDTLLHSKQVQIETHSFAHYREEIWLSDRDAMQRGIKDGEVAILTCGSLSAGKAQRRCGIRFRVNKRVQAGFVSINRYFAETHGLMQNTWYVCPARRIKDVKRVVLEMVVERNDIKQEIHNLRRDYRDLFHGRYLLIEQANKIRDLSIGVAERAYFNVHELFPTPEKMPPDTLMEINERTNLSLFVPHRKGGVDMLVLIDISGSMDTLDYVKNNQKLPRLVGVQDAVETLIRKRMIVGSRVSRLAIVVFGGKTAMLYPKHRQMEELTRGEQVQDILKQIQQNLQRPFLEILQIRQNVTNIAHALKEGADLLNFSGREGNEKVIVLISDGAHWEEQTGEDCYGEIESTLADPVALANTLYEQSQIRIHTITVTNEESYARYEQAMLQLHPDAKGVWNTAPDLLLLRKIAEVTNGRYLECPDSRRLQYLFKEIGQGTTYPLSTRY